MRSWLNYPGELTNGTDVSLVAVLNEICELIAEHEPKWTPAWHKALQDARDALVAQPLDDDTLESWHCQQKATLFLRLEIESERLPIYIRNPGTREIVHLRPQDWIPFSPAAHIPVRGDDNFILDGNYGVALSQGDRVYGELSRALVDRRQVAIFINKRLIRTHNDAPQGSVVRQAIDALSNGGERPVEMAAKARNFAIREWAKKNHHTPPSDATIKRELRKMLLER
jgi:hypothetical protein